MQSTSSYLPGSQRSVKWAPEILVLFWETLQCNKRFRSFIIDSNRSHDFVVLCIFYATEYKLDPSKQGVVRMCVFILQTMSAESTFSKSLNVKFEGQDTLPQSIRLLKFRGSYADFLIMVSTQSDIVSPVNQANQSSPSTHSFLPAKGSSTPCIRPFS